MKLPSDGERGDSVLIADESESSMDILEVAEESSSESGSSASRIQFSDEITSGDEIEVAEEPPAKAGPKPSPKETAPSTDRIVADILGPAPDDSSDEALETLDVDEAVETREVAATESAIRSVTAPPASDDHETVGIAAAEESKAAPPAEETKAALGEGVGPPAWTAPSRRPSRNRPAWKRPKKRPRRPSPRPPGRPGNPG